MSGQIYYIHSAATKRVYVGSTTRGIKQRFSEHLHYLRHGKHHSKHLQRVYSKYGEADLTIELVCNCAVNEDILTIEQQHIDRHAGNVMNTAPVSDSIYAAHAANRGRVMPEAERLKRSESAKRSIVEGRAKRGAWSDERKKAHSIRLTGRKMPPVADSTRANISSALRLRHALSGTAAKPKTPNQRTAFIEQEVNTWLIMRAEGKSYREIERITKRCRNVIARECKRKDAANV